MHGLKSNGWWEAMWMADVFFAGMIGGLIVGTIAGGVTVFFILNAAVAQ